jgi:hypothetical protein
LKLVIVKNPSPDDFAHQEFAIAEDQIIGIKLVMKIGNADHGVQVDTKSGYNNYWMRCPTFEAAEALYADVLSQL